MEHNKNKRKTKRNKQKALKSSDYVKPIRILGKGSNSFPEKMKLLECKSHQRICDQTPSSGRITDLSSNTGNLLCCLGKPIRNSLCRILSRQLLTYLVSHF